PINQWVELNNSGSGRGVSRNPSLSIHPSLAFDSAGKPHLAWEDKGPPSGRRVYYSYWDGEAWQGQAGSNTGKGMSGNISSVNGADASIAIDSQDRPHIAWVGTDTDVKQIYYAYWDGTAWVGVGGSDLSAGMSKSENDSFVPSLVLDSSDNPHIAWSDKSTHTGYRNIYYAYWTGTEWDGLAVSDRGIGVGGRFSKYNGDEPWLALDSHNRPHIAWHGLTHSSSETDIYYTYWDGTAWETKGNRVGNGISNILHDNRQPSLALNKQNVPYIAWSGGKVTDPSYVPPEVYVTYWNGSNWGSIGSSNVGVGISDAPHAANNPVIRLGESNKPHVVWFERHHADNPSQIFVRYRNWDGSNWVTKGTGFFGSNMTHFTYRPGFDVDHLGRPGVSYQNFNASEQEIYFEKWE
ncbi:hypothetical protein ACFL2D_01330, partial [Patescibacteria group bacterium]